MGTYEILDHTADLRLKITGENRDDLFHTAFNGLKALTEIDKAITLDGEFDEVLEVNGDDGEELLIRFLNELIAIIQDKKILPLKILSLNLTQSTLHCSITAKRIGEFPDGYVEIKAATYHMLKIDHLDNKLIVSVVFDI